MIKNIDLDAKTGEIKITAESADDLQTISRLGGVNSHCFALNVKTSPEYRWMETIYHVPENEPALVRDYHRNSKQLGEPQAGINEYGVTIKPLAQSQDGQALPSPEQNTPELYYEDFRQLADNLLKENLITQDQHEQMLELGRTSLPAFSTIFTPSAQQTNLEVTAERGRAFVPYLNDDDYQKMRGENTPCIISPDNIAQMADKLVGIGRLEEEQKEDFIKQLQQALLKTFARDQLISTQSSANLTRIYSTGNYTYSKEEIAASTEYVNIMRTLMDTGDFTALTPQQLKLMAQIGDKSDSIKYTIGDFLLSENVTIESGRIPFGRLCENYNSVIKSTLHAKESGLIDADGSVAGSQAVALPDLLPKNLVHLTYTLTTKIEGGKTLLNLWEDAGNYAKITEVFHTLTNASDNSNNMLGRSDVWRICNRFFDDGYNKRNNLASVAENNEILQAIVAGLAKDIESPLSAVLLPQLAENIPATLPIILDALKTHGDAELLQNMAMQVKHMGMGNSWTEKVSEDSPFSGWEEKFKQAAQEVSAMGEHSAAEAGKQRNRQVGG